MNVVGFYTSKYWQVERCDGSKNGIKRKSSTEDSEQLTTVPLCGIFNLLIAEMDGQGSHMAEKQVG